ncbi:MAG TPA: LysE family transporter [Lacunisphaera sp.]|nr:LysE family transporter [Lacunisphaera sp.]
MSYWPEFLTIVVAHGLAVVSPGPDFAIVLRQSLRHDRATALWTSIGIGCGLSVHITYCLLGLGLFLQKSATALTTVKWLGAAYLAWVGVGALRAKPRSGDVDLSTGATAPTAGAAWATGFLVNVTNPKAALFFISLFPLAVSITTPKWIQVGYGLWMVVTTALWFSFVSVVFTQEEVRRSFLRHGHWIDRALGVVFLGFAASLAFATLR